MTLRLKAIRWLAVLAGAALAVAPVQAQDAYPSKPVTMIVPFAPGGTADLLARMIAQQLTERLGQPFVVENRTGAGGRIGTELLKNATPDGYTVGFGSVSTHGSAVSIVANLPYDPVADFTPIAKIGTIPSAMIVKADFPADTVADFIALAKEKPGAFNFGSAGIGTNQHLGGELFNILAGVDMVHVAYQDQGMVTNDLTNGNIQVAFNTLFNALGQIEAGNFKALAVATDKRWPTLPDVPTMTEAGIPGFEISTWLGLFGPVGMPEAAVTRLNSEINAVLSDPAFAEQMAQSGALPLTGTPDDLRTWVEQQIALWRDVVEKSGTGPQ
jgi:tripartite-type tricarboxylate transporter receptor subunit TctC